MHRVPRLIAAFYPDYLWRLKPNPNQTDRALYLTFDDGPVPGPTEFVLETLAEFGIPATFFCIGDNIRKHPQVFRQILAGGHAVGNHTYNHLNGWRTSAEVYVANVDRCTRVMADNGFSPEGKLLFRPPYGRITRKLAARLADYQIVMWDVLTLDYERHRSPERVFQGTAKALRPGSLIVFHDSFKAENNLKGTLKEVINFGINEGYIFKKIVL